jgi:hypothetical protein
MHVFLKLTAAAAALAGLAACDGGAGKSEGGNAASTAAANTTADANAAAPAGGKDPSAAGGAATPAAVDGQVTREFLVGRWTDNNDCSSTLQINADGRFIAPTGEGLWVLDGDRLTFQGASPVTVRVQAPNANTLMLIHENGTVGRSTRCTS